MSNHDRPRRARGEKRRQALIDAAVQIILESGVSAASHRAIAQRAGVPAASTTYFFPSIDALIGEALTGVLHIEHEKLRLLQQQIVRESMSVEAAIDAFVEISMAGAQANVAALFDMFVAAHRRPALREPVSQLLDAAHSIAENVLAALGVQDPMVAQAATALIDGIALHRLASPEHASPELLRQALRLLFNGAISDRKK